jgi:hypothetical protein
MNNFRARAHAVRRNLNMGNLEQYGKQVAYLLLDVGYEFPESMQLFMDYFIHNRAKDAIGILESLLLEYRPKSTEQVYCLVDVLFRIGRLSESLDILDEYIATHKYDRILSTLRNRVRRYRDYGARIAESGDAIGREYASSDFSCDLITIASNEGPYIADFVHHYFDLGFKHIFIGINSSSTDETLEICSLISDVYPNLHVVSTDCIDFANNDYAEASYYCIWKQATACSASVYCMIADVDEFLMFDGPRNIESFLSRYGVFDVLTIPWIEQVYQEQPFQPPLDLSSQLWRMHPIQQGKSVFRYASAYIDLTAHIPRFLNSHKPVRFIDARAMSDRTYNLFDFGLIPIAGAIGRPLTPSSHDLNSYRCAVLHYYSRSEVEYSTRCLVPYGNESKGFKHNRDGYATDRSASTSIDQNAAFLSSFNIASYHASLEEFKLSCGIQPFIDAATSKYAEGELLSRIHEIPLSHVAHEEKIWRRSFAGTRFLATLERLLAAES